ncbi:PIN domain-containing protein [Dermabacteraceae bacterium P13115]
MAFPVLLDACVLIPMPIADLLLRLGEAKQYRPLWSEDILAEVTRSLTTSLGLPPDKARRRVGVMRCCFPDALVDGYQELVPAMLNQAKDRHVLAAAVRANAELIVTANLRDFPHSALAPYDLAAKTPDDFLLDMHDLNRPLVEWVVEQIVADMNHPRMDRETYLVNLARCGLPAFARKLAG